MSNLPVSKFRNAPPGGRFSESMSKASRAMWQARQQDSTDESRESIVGWNEYFSNFREQTITTPEGQFVVIVKGGGDGTTNGGAPWQTTLNAGGSVRIYPSGIWDGKGNSVWASYQGVQSIAGSYFDVELPGGSHGFVYLECEVDDTDEYHGIIKRAAIDVSAREDIQFLQRDSGRVKIPLVEYFRRAGTYTIDPLRSFIFVLRRYGPPGSVTWDVEPL